MKPIINLLIVLLIFAATVSGQTLSFAVIGHAYGAHEGTNIGLYPPLLNAIESLNHDTDFLVLAGDIARTCSKMSYERVQFELSRYQHPVYWVLGNNDQTPYCLAQYYELHTNPIYSFSKDNNLFIFISFLSQQNLALSSDQLKLIDQTISNSTSENVFIFTHELIWVRNENFKHVFGNWRSRYAALIKTNSNFWEDLAPILTRTNDKKIYVISGDTGAHADSDALHFSTRDNLNFIATGLGNARESNYLLVKINQTEVSISAIPINNGVKLNTIEQYDLNRSNNRIYEQLKSADIKFLVARAFYYFWNFSEPYRQDKPFYCRTIATILVAAYFLFKLAQRRLKAQ